MNKTKGIFITGNGTGIGKTVVSAIVCEALNADYWKPVQAGNLHSSDTAWVSSMISSGAKRCHMESYRLSLPMSPHAAARRDGVRIELEKLTVPETENLLVVEGAGGVLVPLTDEALVADLMVRLALPILLVSRNYLGSINHTLLTLEALRERELSILGVVFNGPSNEDSENFIIEYGKVPCLGRISEEREWSPALVKMYAMRLREELARHL